MTRCRSVLNVYSRPPCSSLILKPVTRPGTAWVSCRAAKARVGPDLRFQTHDVDLLCGHMHGCRQHLPRTLRHQIDAAQRDDRACESASRPVLTGTNNRGVPGNMHDVITLRAMKLDPITWRDHLEVLNSRSGATQARVGPGDRFGARDRQR